MAGAPWLVGLKIGPLVGPLWVTPHATVRAVAHTNGHGIDYVCMTINGAWHPVEQGLGGAIMGLAYGWRGVASGDTKGRETA